MGYKAHFEEHNFFIRDDFQLDSFDLNNALVGEE